MNWEYAYYAVLAIVVIVAIVVTLYLWLNHLRLNRQGEQIKQNARARFEDAAVRATRQGWYAEAKLARTLRDLWR